MMVIEPRGIETVMFFRLCSRAPETTSCSPTGSESSEANRRSPASCFALVPEARVLPLDALSIQAQGGASRLAALRERLTGRDNPVELAPQIADLVAKLRRVLESQLFGRLKHLLFELDDRALQFVGLHPLGDPPPPATRARDTSLGLEKFGDVRDSLDDRFRRDPVAFVVLDLNRAPAVGLLDGCAHRLGLLVRIHDHATLDIAGSPSDGLDQRGLPAQESLLVRV